MKRAGKSPSLRADFNEAYCIARSDFSAIPDNDRAREILACAGVEMQKIFDRCAHKNHETKEQAARRIIGASYQDFLKTREIILARTGNAGKPIRTLG